VLSVGGGTAQVVGLVPGWNRSGDCAQDRVEVVASAEVTGQGPPVSSEADAVLDADPLREWALRSASWAAARAGGTGSWFFRQSGCEVMTAPAVCTLRPW